MSASLELFGFILLVVVTIVGMVGNGFIAIINCFEWFRNRKLSPADMILSCLSFFRLLFLAVMIQQIFFPLFFIDIYLMNYVNLAYDVSWLFVNTADIWFATWLSILYCVKIANFSHPLFLRMKQKFPGLVPWLLLGTVVFSAIATTFIATGTTVLSKCNLYKSDLSNVSEYEIPISCEYLIYLYLIPDLFPFIIFLFSSILLLTSLWRHKNLLRNSARDVSTEVHLNAIKALTSFCVLNVSSFFVEILDDVLVWTDAETPWLTLLLFHVIAAYSSGHAIILIFINPKLKQELVRILHQLKCRMKPPS